MDGSTLSLFRPHVVQKFANAGFGLVFLFKHFMPFLFYGLSGTFGQKIFKRFASAVAIVGARNLIAQEAVQFFVLFWRPFGRKWKAREGGFCLYREPDLK